MAVSRTIPGTIRGATIAFVLAVWVVPQPALPAAYPSVSELGGGFGKCQSFDILPPRFRRGDSLIRQFDRFEEYRNLAVIYPLSPSVFSQLGRMAISCRHLLTGLLTEMVEEVAPGANCERALETSSVTGRLYGSTTGDLPPRCAHQGDLLLRQGEDLLPRSPRSVQAMGHEGTLEVSGDRVIRPAEVTGLVIISGLFLSRPRRGDVADGVADEGTVRIRRVR